MLTKTDGKGNTTAYEYNAASVDLQLKLTPDLNYTHRSRQNL
jgi:hypothetical protein